MKAPASTSCVASRLYSASDPSHQCTRSGRQCAAISVTQLSSRRFLVTGTSLALFFVMSGMNALPLTYVELTVQRNAIIVLGVTRAEEGRDGGRREEPL